MSGERFPRRLSADDWAALSRLCDEHGLGPRERMCVHIDAKSANDPNACLDTIDYFAARRRDGLPPFRECAA